AKDTVAFFCASALAEVEVLLTKTSRKTIAITSGMARVAIQKRRFFTVRVNSKPTTVPRLCRADGRRTVGRGVGGLGAGKRSAGICCVMGFRPPPCHGLRR